MSIVLKDFTSHQTTGNIESLFYDGDTSGIYLPFLRFGEIRSLPPEEVGLYPNPATFLKPLKCDLGSIEATRTWKLSEKDSNRLELDVDFGGVPWKYEIEIDPEHGFLPKSFKAFPVAAASSYNEFINESFLQIDGIWFPVKSRLRYYRGTALGPIFQTERIVVVDTATLRINQQFGAEDFQYRFPDKISIHNQITGQITDPPEAAKVFNAFHKLPKRDPLPATPTPAEVRKTWLAWTWRIAVIGLASLVFSLLIWNRIRIRKSFTTGSMCLAVIIAGVSECNCLSLIASEMALPDPQIEQPEKTNETMDQWYSVRQFMQHDGVSYDYRVGCPIGCVRQSSLSWDCYCKTANTCIEFRHGFELYHREGLCHGC